MILVCAYYMYFVETKSYHIRIHVIRTYFFPYNWYFKIEIGWYCWNNCLQSVKEFIDFLQKYFVIHMIGHCGYNGISVQLLRRAVVSHIKWVYHITCYYWITILGDHSEIRIPLFVDMEHLNSYHLNQDGIRAARQILCVLEHSCPDIIYSPLLFSVLSLFLHYMDTSRCYNCLYALLRNKNGGYLPTTKVSFEASKRVIRDLAKKYAVSKIFTIIIIIFVCFFIFIKLC